MITHAQESELVDGLLALASRGTASSLGIALSCDGSGLCTSTFLDSRGVPVAKALFAAWECSRPLVIREIASIDALSRLGEEFATHLPVVLGRGDFSLGPVVYYDYIRGRPVRLEDIGRQEFLDAVIDWIADLHSSCGDRVEIGEDLLDRAVTDPLHRVLAKTCAGNEIADAAETGIGLARRVIGQSVPKGAAHMDLWFGNVLRSEDGSEFRVIDWSMSTLDGLPLLDPLYWFIYNAAQWFSTDLVGAARMCVGGETDYSRLFLKAIRRYCSRLNWRPQCLGAWFAALFLNTYAARAAQSGCKAVPLSRMQWLLGLPQAYELGETLGALL